MRFALPPESAGPDFLVSRIRGHVESIDDGHAARQLTRRFNVNEVRTRRQAKGGVQRNGHGDRIWQGNSLFAGLPKIGLSRRAVRAYGEFAHSGLESQNSLDVLPVERGLATAQMPSHHFYRQTGTEYDAHP